MRLDKEIPSWPLSEVDDRLTSYLKYLKLVGYMAAMSGRPADTHERPPCKIKSGIASRLDYRCALVRKSHTN